MALAPFYQLRPPRFNFLGRLSSSSSKTPKPSWLQTWTPPSLPKRPLAALDYRAALSSDDDEVGTSRSTGSTTMRNILEKLKQMGYIDDEGDHDRDGVVLPEKGSVEDIFYAEDGILPDERGGLCFDPDKARFPWEKREGGSEAGVARKKRSKSWLAELTLPVEELRRLRHLALRTKSRVKIKGRGVTSEVVDVIHSRWQMEEVVRIKCEGSPALNMKKVHDMLERRTGGLVIWRSGSSLSLYRGVGYEIPQQEKRKYQTKEINGAISSQETTHIPLLGPFGVGQDGTARDPPKVLLPSTEEETAAKPLPEVKYEHEVDMLLDELGPRYVDWPGGDPLPVDADLLPGTAPGYKPPFRLLPYGVRSNLGRKEGTALRRLARVLPPHFALGRTRQHEGLAAAMIKLWERSSIAKIALKRGVQLTTSERMAEDIKKLTGGTLLSRCKDFLVFYRGKNFLSSEVAEALIERERLAKALQDEEEQARLRASSLVVSDIEAIEQPGSAGTLGETLDADARWGSKLDDEHENKMKRAVEHARHAVLVKKLESKLSLAEWKLMKAEKALVKVEEFLKPLEPTTEPESITDEERFMFRKLGIRMKAYLLLGRRGVFAGTVENMHLHWKYRELIKIIVKAKTFAEVRGVALSLEAESGGVLVSVDKISKGFAIIVYRGKDYKRPSTLRPKNLLTKRKALARSIELQRLEALNKHISILQKRVEKLRSELDQMENVEDRGDEELYAQLDSAYSTEEEETEDEGDEAYLETFDAGFNVQQDEEDDIVNCYHEGEEGDDGDENKDDNVEDENYFIDGDDDDATEGVENHFINDLQPSARPCCNQRPELRDPLADSSKLSR